jgi:hypothetical protein
MNTRWVALSLVVAVGCDAGAYSEPLDDTDDPIVEAPEEIGAEPVEPPPVVASADIAPPAEAIPGDATPATLHFAPDLASARAGVIRDAFAILDQNDVVAVFTAGADAGTHLLEIRLRQPSGHLYQAIWRAYSTDPSAPAAVSHPTLGESIPLERVAPEGERVVAPVGIPIAGSDIARYRLTGLFTVEAYLDGELAAENAFEMTLF